MTTDRQPLDELDEKIQKFVAVYAPGISMHDHAVLCEGIMDIIAATHTSIPALGKPRPPCEECIYQSQSAEHDAQVAKSERERVFSIINQIRETAVTGLLNTPSGYFSSREKFRKECMEEIDLLVESLRPQQEEFKDCKTNPCGGDCEGCEEVSREIAKMEKRKMPEGIELMTPEEIISAIEDAVWEKSWEIDTHSDDGFQQIVYMSEFDKIVEDIRKRLQQ